MSSSNEGLLGTPGTMRGDFYAWMNRRGVFDAPQLVSAAWEAWQAAYANLLTAREGARPVAWMMELAKEIRANAKDHPKETMSRFALLWADQLAARSVTTSPTDADVDWCNKAGDAGEGA